MARVIVLEPNGKYRIEQATGLEGLQALVGGSIERVPLNLPGFDGLTLWANEDFIGLDLDPNLWSLVVGRPLLGSLVLSRDSNNQRDATAADCRNVAELGQALRSRLVQLGLHPGEPEIQVTDWPDEPPRAP